MKDIKVSVIIPVYNVEKYLDKCLDSVINQTFKDIEIICINDSSSDNSLNILEDYAKLDDRISIINNKENRGGGFSRNEGLKLVKGEYISFIDADDWVEINMLERTYNEAKRKNLDLLFFLAKNFDDYTGEIYETDYYNFKCFENSFDNKVFHPNEVKDFIFRIAVSPWLKLYKKDLLDKSNAMFPEERVMHDNPFFYQVFLNANRVELIREYFYYRRRHNESLINMRPKWLLHIIPISNSIVNAFKENNQFNDYKVQVINRKLNIIRNQYENMGENYKKAFFKEIKKDFHKVEENPTQKLEYIVSLNRRNLIFYLNALNAESYSEFVVLNENHNLKINIRNLRKNLKSSKRENKSLKSKIKSMESSNSWKVTKPIRKFNGFFRNSDNE